MQTSSIESLTDGRAARFHFVRPVAPTSGVALVLVHGAANDHRVWLPLAASLAQAGHTVLLPDLPGHGRSVGPGLSSIEAMAAWLLAALPLALQQAGARRAVLGGHSMGSLVALEAAARGPTPEQLWLLATAAPMRVAPALLATAQSQATAAVDSIVAWSHQRPDLALHEVTRQVMLDNLAIDPQTLHRDLNACQAYAGAEAAAARVLASGCAVHLVQGSADRMTPARAAAGLAQALAAQVHELPAGHALMSEAPEALAALLAQGLSTLQD